MFADLRKKLGLTQAELAKATNRTPNYIFKAESLTFPNAPPSLLAYFSKRTGLPPSIIKAEYRAAQRTRRQQFLEYYIPVLYPLSGLSFRRIWKIREHSPLLHGGHEHFLPYSPSEYVLSQRLCIPATAVYRAEKDGYINQSILTALSDLVEYCINGNYIADYGYLDRYPYDVVEGVNSIQKELHRRVGFGYKSQQQSQQQQQQQQQVNS